MNIFVISIQTSKDENIESLILDYTKRLRGSFSQIEIKLSNNFSSIEKQKDYEADLIRKKIPESSYVIAMDERGSLYDSNEFEKFIYKKTNKNLVFIIGGANGLSKKILSLSDISISLSKMTMPHKIAKLVLIEQIYRAQQININHPYHK